MINLNSSFIRSELALLVLHLFYLILVLADDFGQTGYLVFKLTKKLFIGRAAWIDWQVVQL